jgi:nicotinate (nicotinamide) nucleotide adenylyltransferase
MSTFQIRRLPVLRRDMNIAGIVSLGDLSVSGGKTGRVIAQISKHTGSIRSMKTHHIEGVEQSTYFDEKTKEKGLHSTQYFANNEFLTPMNTIRNQLLQHGKDGLDRKYAIFISTGSYCPIHRMHTQIFEDAKDYMTKLGFTVIGGFLSPSHYNHVLAKLGDNAVSSYHRIKMVELATDESPWLTISKWESSQPSMVNYDQVTASIADLVSTVVTPLTVFYLCGADIAMKSKLWTCGQHFKSIAICRPGYSSQLISFLQSQAQEDEQQDSSHEQFNYLENTINKCFYLVESPTEDISSTVVRNRLLKGLNIDSYCHPEVVRYIQQNNLFKRTATGQ